ncbi:fasciclin domain-containing protein [Amycolatopsis sp. CA-230715]|uniref:fasciclin domain-containing protein n=1 Tax=Amycolatopsis sp. CA-230715 TaxID=2745196 RepID=UPI001C3405AB|nr:fasciclin domain-containing protein [Amycolatopsis sp. CA-230715]QWF79896.1 Cell surface glycolipoprotein MPB83 [Amycolatopsis sp. CA-230715]
MSNLRRVAGLGVATVAAFSMAACGSDSGSGSGNNSSSAPAPSSPMSSSSAAAPAGTGVTTKADVFGPACSKVPATGPGSVDGMVSDPVATAASNNPLLTKLVTAVKATNLVDPLNSAQELTVFAPADDPAFKELGDAKFTELAGKPADLTKILKYHVVPKRYDAKGLEAAGMVPTLDGAEGGDLKIAGSGDKMTVNGAPVLCGNVPVKNATVFVIGKVLMPGTNK